ncbi:GumC family protein [Aureimonas sp. ME7]|uniref:GumC family protein n=1 Tax=Aureimonas sp. ME7 TaxID=2744252 RepID=UPI0015F4EEED|nr:GumC family protein [Aureimonas sp. ME7]
MFYAESAESRPASRWDPAPAGEGATKSFLDPAYLAGAVWRARTLILVMGVLGAVAAGAVAMSSPKQYTAATQIVLDPRDLNLVQNEVAPTANGLNTEAALALIESQIAVITSGSVLGRVVDEANLTADPEFGGAARSTWLSRLSATLTAISADEPENAVRDRKQRTINLLQRHVTATRNPNSFVINLSVSSEDPEKAARLANLTTEIFIAEQGRAQSELARRATASLSSRLAELRARVVESEDAVEAYKAKNQLVGVGGRLIDDEFITRINNQLADVRTQITALNVRARSLREASVEDVASGSFPEGLNAESLLRLRQIYSEAAQNQAVLATRLGPRHPQRIAADQAVSTARRAIQTELSRIVASAQTELARAQATEADLSTQIETLRSRQIETSGAFVRLRELEREVDASRAVYEAYLLRTRQTSEQESLNSANVRVISDASVPFQPSSLSRKIVVVVGLILGLGVGIALALGLAILSLFRNGRQRVPESATAAAASDRLRAQRNEAQPEPAMAEASAHEPSPAAARTQAFAPADDFHPTAPQLPERAEEAEAPGMEDWAGDWSLRGALGDAEPPGDAVPDEDAMEPSPASDIEERRDALRRRIRELGERRFPLGGASGERETSATGEALPRDERRERISLRLAAARQRRMAGEDEPATPEA